MTQDSTKRERRSLSATAANDIAKTGSTTTADQLDVQIHLALTATRADFRAARIAAMKWDLSDAPADS